MRILFTETHLDERRGSQLFTRDVALGLLHRGHSPVVYSTADGELGDELRAATVPVVSDLAALGEPPDVIHGHHHLDTVAALLRFPGTPALCFCHTFGGWGHALPRLPSIALYVAVDSACRDRLVLSEGIAAEHVRTLLNFVDLERFEPRAPLPPRPMRALLFGSYPEAHPGCGAVAEACRRLGLPLDVVGGGGGPPTAAPEDLLPRYDLVFAKGRAALEAMAVGAAVVLVARSERLGPLVRTENLDRLRPLNFGARAMEAPVEVDHLVAEIRRYDAADAAAVSRRIRAEAGIGKSLDELLDLYAEALERRRRHAPDPAEDAREAARYLGWVSARLHERNRLSRQVRALRSRPAAADEGGLRSRLRRLVARLRGGAGPLSARR